MNTVTKMLSLVVLSFLAIGFRANAQVSDTLAKLKSSTPEQRAQMQNSLMKEKLRLTADQYGKISAINLQYARKIEPILRSDDGRFSKYRKAKPILEEKDEKLKAVLTPDQFQKYQDIKKEMMDRAKNAYKG